MISDRQRFPQQGLRSAHSGPSQDHARRVLAGRGTRGLGPITMRVGDEVITVLPADPAILDDPVTIVDGPSDDAEVVVEFASPEAFSDFSHEMRTVAGLHVTGAVSHPVGGFAEFDYWEPALRALYHGRPVYDPADIDLADAERSFDWDEVDNDPDVADDLAAFLRRYGWAHVRNVFNAGEIATLNAEVDRVEAAASPDTPGSWWTRDGDGDEQPCQLHYLGLASTVIGALDHDRRVERLVGLSGDDLANHPDRALGTFAVLKRPTAAEGLTNLPWHIDCGLGGHPLTCPGLHLAVQLTASNPDLGAFKIVPGSHDASVRRSDVEAGRCPVVTADTQTGDVTLHMTHAVHAAPAPLSSSTGRRTMYLGFGPQDLENVIGAGQSFDDLITQTSTDGHVRFNAGAPGAV